MTSHFAEDLCVARFVDRVHFLPDHPLLVYPSALPLHSESGGRYVVAPLLQLLIEYGGLVAVELMSILSIIICLLTYWCAGLYWVGFIIAGACT